MRIGIDARLWREAGVGRYIRNLIYHLQEIDKNNQYFVFLLKRDFNQVSLSQNFKKIEANFSWYGVSEQLNFPKLLAKYSLDLVHFPHFNVPVFYNKKFVVTVHDLIHQHFKMERATTLNPLVYKIKQMGYRRVFSHAINKSKKIITVSDFVKTQLRDEMKIQPDKITVTKEAAEDSIIALSKKISKEKINDEIRKLGIKPPFVFYVGNAHPHKNVEGLIKAFNALRKKYQYLQLVLSGHDHYFWKRVKKENQGKDIIYTGYITDDQLVALYKGAQVFVMPSLEEGFGIPLLEAFACGCPVVSSNQGSLSEVGGEAAIYFDPGNIQEMVNKIEFILNNNPARKKIIEKGEQRCKQFSWKKLAQETKRIYEQSGG